MRRFLLLTALGPMVLGVLAWGSRAVGQSSDGPVLHRADAAPTTTISVNAKLVNLPVVVRDKKGALVTNLKKEDFTLQVDEKPQVIRYFDLDNNLPLTLGLLVDTSMSQRKALDEERTASATFLETMLTPQRDKAFIMQFAHQAELLQDLTDSRPKLQAALKEIDSDSSSGNNSGGGRGGSAGTTLYDAVFLAADELMAKQTGRKALIVLSDGDDRGSKENLTKAIEAAQRADVIIYAIYFKGESGGGNSGGGFPGGGGRGGGFPGGRGGGFPGSGGGRGGGRPSGGQENREDGRKILFRMSTETGGRLFEMSKKLPVAEIYKQIAEELRSQYRLGYTPDAETASDGYHTIDLRLKRSDAKDLSIQTRDGYYTGKPEN